MAKKVAPPPPEEEVAEAFADYGTTVRGYVRYYLSRRNLKPYLGRKPLQVLDVGGGSGGDAAWLAEQGHMVTFIEPSAVQRRFAERRFNFLLTAEKRTRIQVVGDTVNVLPPTAKQSFDVVIMHGVAMLQSDPHRFIRRALKYVKRGGLISLMEKGYYGTEMSDIRDRNFADLYNLHRTGRTSHRVRSQVLHAFKPEELENLLIKEEFDILEWSGVRLISDDFDDSAEDMNPRQLKIILNAEYRHGHHPAIRGQGQLLHFIARRA